MQWLNHADINTKDFWDGQWQKRQGFSRQYPGWLLELLPESGSILNVACGHDNLAGVFKERVTCFDMSEGALAFQQEFTPNVVCGTADALPFGDGSFGVVWASHVLEHLREPVKALHEWVRVAGQSVMVIVPHDDTLTHHDEHLWKFTHDSMTHLGLLFGASVTMHQGGKRDIIAQIHVRR